MLIAEVASAGDGAAKAGWIRGMFASLRRGFPKVRGLIWFDKADGEMDWPVESSPLAVDAFAQGLRRGYKQSAFSELDRSPIPPPRR
jgi:hypothetical protein